MSAVPTVRLSRTTRRLVLLVHLVAALGWFGVDVVMGVLAVTGFTSDDPVRIAACYTALDLFAVPLLLVFGLTALASGLVLGAGSRWGVLRSWWVVVKLALNLVLSGLVLVALRPVVGDAVSESAVVDPSLHERLGHTSVDLLFPAFVSGTALLVAAWLGIFKPWGRTPWGERVDAGRGRAPTTRS